MEINSNMQGPKRPEKWKWPSVFLSIYRSMICRSSMVCHNWLGFSTNNEDVAKW